MFPFKGFLWINLMYSFNFKEANDKIIVKRNEKIIKYFLCGDT